MLGPVSPWLFGFRIDDGSIWHGRRSDLIPKACDTCDRINLLPPESFEESFRLEDGRPIRPNSVGMLDLVREVLYFGVAYVDHDGVQFGLPNHRKHFFHFPL